MRNRKLNASRSNLRISYFGFDCRIYPISKFLLLLPDSGRLHNTHGGGVGLVVLSFLTGNWSGFLLTLAAGVLSAIAGIAMLSYPLSGAVTITMVIGILLITAGIFRSVASSVMQFPNWGWSLVSGLWISRWALYC